MESWIVHHAVVASVPRITGILSIDNAIVISITARLEQKE